ncbi:hypothetical protein [Sphingobium xenophagum]|uniref:Uncharacterized protein n=1 Tax=Sphingobium xenophagum TaxID=121428 RepID=A0A401J4Q5_SPHXE|nr:hypothetical protein [Sphingobium xenophagum]GBH31560.1 hypothetical protein MBESOW_P2817 [Sphingobium xenophagum]
MSRLSSDPFDRATATGGGDQAAFMQGCLDPIAEGKITQGRAETGANPYVGLGQLLAAAGVSTDRTEQLIADILIDDARETRLAVSRDICTLVDGYVAGLDQRYGRRLDDAQSLLLRLSIELEVSKRRTKEERSGRSRVIIALLLLQLLGVVGIIAALALNGAFAPSKAASLAAGREAAAYLDGAGT